MSDPVGIIGQPGGAGGVGGARSIGHPGRMEGAPGVDPDQPGFKDFLMENLQEVNRLQSDAEKGIEDLLAGKRDDIEAVMTNIEKADTTFRMLLQVRNKVMQAYDELKQIRV
ncbi:MAG: flagellar hook-basal body complex protein FliE [Phycisphaerales bacterium]|nr:flagellar hook-basal body complex protein FliE [Phycisphaerales bacterium]